MDTIARIDYPFGSIEWSNGCATVTHRDTGSFRSEYLTDYQSRVGYPRQHLSGEYALQFLFADGSMGFNPQLSRHSSDKQALVLNLIDPRHPDIELTLRMQLHPEGVFTQQVSLRNGTTGSLQILRASSATAALQAATYYATTFRGVWAGEHTLQQQEVLRGNTLSVQACTGIKTVSAHANAFTVNIPSEGIQSMMI